MNREKLFSITANDLRWDFFRGSGHGGQKKQKTSSAVRCVHEESGATGRSEESRSQLENKRIAFKRMAETEEFKKWIKLECAKRTGELELIEEKVEQQLKEAVVEIIKDGKWTRTNLGELENAE